MWSICRRTVLHDVAPVTSFWPRWSWRESCAKTSWGAAQTDRRMKLRYRESDVKTKASKAVLSRYFDVYADRLRSASRSRSHLHSFEERVLKKERKQKNRRRKRKEKRTRDFNSLLPGLMWSRSQSLMFNDSSAVECWQALC